MKPAIVLAAWAVSTQAFAAGSFEDRMDACASLSDNFARLACYDREMQARRASGANAEQPAAEAPKSAGASSATPAPRAPAASRPAPAPAPEPAAFTAKVVSVTRPTGREMRIELDNGQVWRENERSIDIQVDPGDEVRIRPAALGSFMLRAPSGRSTRVHREK